MFWLGIAFLVVGALWTAFKGYVVWDVAHDVFNGGGVPTLDFAVFCPIPVAVGLGFLFPHQLSCGAQFGVYVGLVVVYRIVHWLFDRIGAPERARQLANIQRNSRPPAAAS